jgi:hypothetical protein
MKREAEVSEMFEPYSQTTTHSSKSANAGDRGLENGSGCAMHLVTKQQGRMLSLGGNAAKRGPLCETPILHPGLFTGISHNGPKPSVKELSPTDDRFSRAVR